MKTWLGLELGGTMVRAGIVDDTGKVLARAAAPSREKDGPGPWLEAGLGAARLVLEQRHRDDPEPGAIGLAVPGAVDSERTLLVDLVARLDAGAGIDLAEGFSLLGLPVAADNDARAALAGEMRWGAARDVDNVVLITLDTGMGGAVLVNGLSPGGERILAGNQIGHFTVDLDGPPCVCGNRGCAETSASATGLLRLGFERGVSASDALGVFEAEIGGDMAAHDAVNRFIDALTATIVTAIHAYQPDLVLLAGELMRSSDRFLDEVRDGVATRAWTLPRGRVRVEPAALGDDTNLVGAAALAARANA